MTPTPVRRPRTPRGTTRALRLAVPLLACALAGGARPARAAAQVVNHSAHPVWLLPEDDVSPLVSIPPHSVYRGAQDALAVPALFPGQVFKTCDRCAVTIGARGEITTACAGPVEWLAQRLLGGFLDRSARSWGGRWAELWARADGRPRGVVRSAARRP